MREQAGDSEQLRPMVESIAKVKLATSQAWQKQVKTTDYMRQVTQALNKIAEQLAEKEIEIDPRAFVHRETITRTISKKIRNSVPSAVDDRSVFYSFKDTTSNVQASDLDDIDTDGIKKPHKDGQSNSEPSPNRARIPKA